jgi:hypothetical protein
VLADGDLLSRALIARGEVAPVVDAWWVGGPTATDASARVAALRLGRVVTRAGVATQLVGGPLHVGCRATLLVLVIAVVLFVLVGTAVHVTADLHARALEVARLRGLGVSRRDVVLGLLLQHGGVHALLVAVGAVVGAAASWALAPLLVRSEVGRAPVPAALAAWPWQAEVRLLVTLVVGGVVVAGAVLAVQGRRAAAAQLRTGG